MDDHARIRDLVVRIEGDETAVAELVPALEAHLDFEEREILPRLAAHLPSGTGPIRTIREDHQSIRALLVDLAVDPSASTVRVHLAARLEAHFRMEEELILPFARAHFCEEALRRIGCAPSGASHGATS